MTPPLVGLRRGVGLVRREVRSIHSNGATPPSRGCERWPFVSVRGSCPQITEQEAALTDPVRPWQPQNRTRTQNVILASQSNATIGASALGEHAVGGAPIDRSAPRSEQGTGDSDQLRPPLPPNTPDWPRVAVGSFDPSDPSESRSTRAGWELRMRRRNPKSYPAAGPPRGRHARSGLQPAPVPAGRGIAYRRPRQALPV